MRLFSLPFEVPHRLRAIVRARESSVIVLAVIIGIVSGLAVAAMGETVGLMHQVFSDSIPASVCRAASRSIRFMHSCRRASAVFCLVLSPPM